MSNSNQEKWGPKLIDALLPVFATIAALLVGAVMLLLLKGESYRSLQSDVGWCLWKPERRGRDIGKGNAFVAGWSWDLYLFPWRCY